MKKTWSKLESILVQIVIKILNWFFKKTSVLGSDQKIVYFCSQFFEKSDLNRSLSKLWFKGSLKSFWKSPVLNCFQNLFKWLKLISVPSLVQSFEKFSSDQKSDQDLELVSVLNSDQIVVPNIWEGSLKRLTWIDSHPNCDQKFDQDLEFVVESVLIRLLFSIVAEVWSKVWTKINSRFWKGSYSNCG